LKNYDPGNWTVGNGDWMILKEEILWVVPLNTVPVKIVRETYISKKIIALFDPEDQCFWVV
jgi:hypothetical protein